MGLDPEFVAFWKAKSQDYVYMNSPLTKLNRDELLAACAALLATIHALNEGNVAKSRD